MSTQDGHDKPPSAQWGRGKKKPLAVSGFEFVMMGSDGALSKKGISQIRAHTTRELHKTRRETGQALVQRRRNRAGNIFFGAQTDAFRVLPHLPVEDKKPGVFDEIKHRVFTIFNQKTMQESIWPQGVKDGTFFTGMLLMCSVHLDGLSSKSMSDTTTALKMEAMRLVRGGSEGAEEYLMHRNAYAVLIKEANRLKMFEDSKFCKDILRIITVIAVLRRCRIPTFGLAPPMDSRTLLQEYEHVFEDQWHTRSGPEPELYSPFYDGRNDSCDDPFPFVSSDHLRILLQMMQSVVQTWIRGVHTTSAESNTADNLILKSLYRRIFSMPSSKVRNMPCTDDHVYEACRLTSVLLVRSVESQRHWRTVAQGGSILHDIRNALQKTDLDALWGKQIGLLYYVVVVFHSAAFDTPDYLFGHVLQGRVHFEVTHSYSDWHGALQPMGVLNDLMPTIDLHSTSDHRGPELIAGYSSSLADMQTKTKLLDSQSDTDSNS